MANALGTLFGEIASAIREKNGETGTMKPAEFPEKIAAIETGGGSSADVRYVTFMNHDGTKELGKKAVATGDDCADPIARGVFDTPTRESTAQYNYTFAGWATEVNGGLDSNALKAVTEDRTVYANFAAVLRYYTITYYDGETVLKTESLAYGTMPSYSAEKDGYGFEGWEPSLDVVTGDANYTAVWSELLTFSNASWTQIAEIVSEGTAKEYFDIGDEKILTLTFDGSTINVPVQVAGFEHDSLADGSGKAALSIVCGQSISTIATGAMDAYRWVYSGIRHILNSGLIYAALPSELRAALKPVLKVTGNGRCVDGSFTTGAAQTTTDTLWLLSIEEVNLSNTYNDADEGESYPIFTDDTSRIRRDIKGNKTRYLLRSGNTEFYKSMGCIKSDGTLYYGATSTTASANSAIVFGFCI